jgi:hypothetical protein
VTRLSEAFQTNKEWNLGEKIEPIDIRREKFQITISQLSFVSVYVLMLL